MQMNDLIHQGNVLVCKEHSLHKSGILLRQYALVFRKEILRKTIHLCTLAIPFALKFARTPVLVLLALALVVYTVAEILRMHNKTVPIISAITAAASRKRDENRFVLGPVTLCVGILLSALLFSDKASAIGIYALGAGDGLASLTGKMFGAQKIPFTGGKSVVGSLTCFVAVFLLTVFVSHAILPSLVIAFVCMFVEMLPLKDFDNVLIPLVASFIAQFCFGL